MRSGLGTSVSSDTYLFPAMVYLVAFKLTEFFFRQDKNRGQRSPPQLLFGYNNGVLVLVLRSTKNFSVLFLFPTIVIPRKF